jgi:hypothetical protein
LSRAAGQAGRVFSALQQEEQERADRLVSEARQQVNLDRDYELRRQSAERQDAIFKQQQEQLDEFGSFAQEQLRAQGIDPSSIGGLRGEGAMRAAEVLIHQKRVSGMRDRVQNKIRTLQDRFGVSPIIPADAGGAVAPGVMTDEGVAAAQAGAGTVDANDPRQVFVNEVQGAFDSAMTMEDYQSVAASIDRAMLESIKQEQDAAKRTQMTELLTPFVKTIIDGTKDPELGAALQLAMISYSNSDIDMPDMLEIMLEAAREGEDTRVSIYEKARLDAAKNDRWATIPQKQEAIDALENGERVAPEPATSSEQESAATSSGPINLPDLFKGRDKVKQMLNRVRAKTGTDRGVALLDELEAVGLSGDELQEAWLAIMDDYDLN